MPKTPSVPSWPAVVGLEAQIAPSIAQRWLTVAAKILRGKNAKSTGGKSGVR